MRVLRVKPSYTFKCDQSSGHMVTCRSILDGFNACIQVRSYLNYFPTSMYFPLECIGIFRGLIRCRILPRFHVIFPTPQIYAPSLLFLIPAELSVPIFWNGDDDREWNLHFVPGDWHFVSMVAVMTSSSTKSRRRCWWYMWHCVCWDRSFVCA